MTALRVRPAMELGTLVAALDPGAPYRRPLPRIAGARPDWQRRPLLRHMFETVEPPAAALVLLRDATVRGTGVITLADDTIVAESLINNETDLSGSHLRRTGPDSFTPEPGFGPAPAGPPGRYVLLRQLYDLNYGHWLIEILPRMALLEGIDLAALRFVVSDIEGMGPGAVAMAQVMRSSLAYCGVTTAQVVTQGWGPRHYPELLYPLPLTQHPWVKAPLAIAMLDELGHRIAPHPSGATHLYVDRPPGGRRAMHNAAAVAALAAARGFTRITPADLGFAAQAEAFARATHIVGVLGAELANLVFASPGVALLGLAPFEMQDDFFYDLVSLKAGTYTCLHAADGALNDDFTLDLAAFDAILETWAPTPLASS